MRKPSILFVCTENICRSPMAEGILKALLKENGLRFKVRVESAGTICTLPGSKPDARVKKVLRTTGIRLWGFKSRKFSQSDFVEFDYILTMDEENLRILKEACPPELRNKLEPIMVYAPEYETDIVPDPYFGSTSQFMKVKEMLSTALKNFVSQKLNA